MACLQRGRWGVDRLTYDESQLTLGVLVAAGHHGSHCVINHRYKVQVKLLEAAINSFPNVNSIQML